MMKKKSLCVYCGSRPGNAPIFAETATKLGASIADEDWRLVYGGGKMGLMGTVASAVRDRQGDVFGIIPDFLVELEGVLEGVDHTIVKTMHERKMMMFEESDAICTLPGGIGTLEEIIELLSWARLDLHRKPLVVLNVEGFWSPLIELLEHVIDSGFAAPELRNDIIVVDRAEDVIPAAKERIVSAVM
ncbi:TIGR00730 family Rossman fold protein [Parvularcula sp. LCG005]|uniref:LOG family protein n=1 Tax=Parvularcula sp. LCG005 TaxID=3078805 RepID=UPI002942CB00|nr:TIGR00730 family Rossman fold protein [Parvularcula sp. LCG005]WOI54380.1 TIGR00730 family Rossman fold protein [Parvularcula sp. LCG005]